MGTSVGHNCKEPVEEFKFGVGFGSLRVGEELGGSLSLLSARLFGGYVICVREKEVDNGLGSKRVKDAAILFIVISLYRCIEGL